MKKRSHVTTILLLSLCVMFLYFEMQIKVANASMLSEERIPKEAIRLRILANSDSDADQALKRKIRDQVNAQISTWVGNLTDINTARKVIKSELPAINETVRKNLKAFHANPKFKVQFGQVPFPTKLYGNYVYPAGKYEAVLITLGKGQGANWWCVLFPPLCFLDFENGDAVKADDHHAGNTADSVAAPAGGNYSQKAAQPEQSPVQIKFFVVELFDTIMNALKSLFS